MALHPQIYVQFLLYVGGEHPARGFEPIGPFIVLQRRVRQATCRPLCLVVVIRHDFRWLPARSKGKQTVTPLIIFKLSSGTDLTESSDSLKINRVCLSLARQAGPTRVWSTRSCHHYWLVCTTHIVVCFLGTTTLTWSHWRTVRLFDIKRRCIYGLVSINQEKISHPSPMQQSMSFQSVHPLVGNQYPRTMFKELINLKRRAHNYISSSLTLETMWSDMVGSSGGYSKFAKVGDNKLDGGALGRRFVLGLDFEGAA